MQLDEGALKAAPQTMKRLAAEIGRGFDDLDDVEVAELRAALGRLMPDRLRLRLDAQKPDLLWAHYGLAVLQVPCGRGEAICAVPAVHTRICVKSTKRPK